MGVKDHYLVKYRNSQFPGFFAFPVATSSICFSSFGYGYLLNASLLRIFSSAAACNLPFSTRDSSSSFVMSGVYTS
ncbi:hypothetical protein AYI70_g11196 [Smittium culicis]|uniref:Uncharacterized protein n=1 Tax=Smittium culicis TaxID=133412 RepID=A0A1R1X2W7_9FUNG|nr:hypothetical protein AYI70_g11196 [Smittium culicis]